MGCYVIYQVEMILEINGEDKIMIDGWRIVLLFLMKLR